MLHNGMLIGINIQLRSLRQRRTLIALVTELALGVLVPSGLALLFISVA